LRWAIVETNDDLRIDEKLDTNVELFQLVMGLPLHTTSASKISVRFSPISLPFSSTGIEVTLQGGDLFASSVVSFPSIGSTQTTFVLNRMWSCNRKCRTYDSKYSLTAGKTVEH